MNLIDHGSASFGNAFSSQNLMTPEDYVYDSRILHMRLTCQALLFLRFPLVDMSSHLIETVTWKLSRRSSALLSTVSKVRASRTLEGDG